MDEREAAIVRAELAETKFAMLKSLIKALPKYDKIETMPRDVDSHALYYIVVHKGNACWPIGKFESLDEAGALAALLRERKEQP